MSSKRYILFLLVAAGLFLAMQRGYIVLRNTHEQVLNHSLNAVVSATCINLLHPASDVTAVDAKLVSRTATINVMKGCEGFEVMLLFIAVLLAYPMAWRRKLLGVLLGSLLIYAINIVRIVSLYFIKVHYPRLFDATHVTVWQTIIIFVAGIFFLFWIRPAPEEGGAEGRVMRDAG